jgi:hypothetical protein
VREPDPEHWLYRHTPREWLRAALGELEQARRAYAARNGRAGLTGCRRAAGVALNGWLASLDAPPESYGRSYMDHLAALALDESAPEAARDAARVLRSTPLPGGEIVALRTATADARALDAAETVMAHAYAGVVRAEPDGPA